MKQYKQATLLLNAIMILVCAIVISWGAWYDNLQAVWIAAVVGGVLAINSLAVYDGCE